MNRFIQAGLVLVIGAVILPLIKVILDHMIETMVMPIPSLTEFEAMIMGFYPLSLLVAVFVAAILVIRRKKVD